MTYIYLTSNVKTSSTTYLSPNKVIKPIHSQQFSGPFTPVRDKRAIVSPCANIMKLSASKV